MNRRKWYRISGGVAIGLAVVLHVVLKHALADSSAAAVLLSPGGHASAGALAAMLALVGTRLVVVLLLPGLVFAAAGRMLLDRVAGKSENGRPSAGAVPPASSPSGPPDGS